MATFDHVLWCSLQLTVQPLCMLGGSHIAQLCTCDAYLGSVCDSHMSSSKPNSATYDPVPTHTDQTDVSPVSRGTIDLVCMPVV
jgi:hypothetical protein